MESPAKTQTHNLYSITQQIFTVTAGCQAMGKGTARTETFLTPKLMCLLLSQQPWQRSCVGACVLVPEGVWMTQFLPSPHTQVTLPNHTWNQKIGWPAALSAHTKDNSSFQPQMWPCGLGCSCTLFPTAMPPPLSGAAYQADWQDSS